MGLLTVAFFSQFRSGPESQVRDPWSLVVIEVPRANPSRTRGMSLAEVGLGVAEYRSSNRVYSLGNGRSVDNRLGP